MPNVFKTGNTNYDKIVLVPVSGNVKADVNADGELNSNDLSGLVQHILGSGTVTLPDVNGDGKVDIIDIVAMKKIFASL